MLLNFPDITDRRCNKFSRAQDWEEMSTRFQRRLILNGDTYNPQRLFDVTPIPLSGSHHLELPEGTHVLSPEGNFRYTEVILPRGEWLSLVHGNRHGKVCFDSDIAIPRLNSRAKEGFNRDPWMSLTPMEVLTNRSGVRRAKGHTVVAGLGMGWTLQRVAEKKNVHKITLVEISQELIDWILPCLDLGGKEVEVVCGDAHEILPELSADVALADIWMGYGGNRLHKRCPNIDFVWCWGSQYCC